jgi:1-phosphofructokinase
VVFTPSPLLTVTIEARADGESELHVHVGGQGVWVARMLLTLGVETTLCAALGGETGAMLAGLIEREGLGLREVSISGSNAGYVHDRRGGDRQTVVRTKPPPLDRHELDDLYVAALVDGAECDVAVLAGPDGEDVLPPQTYRRLASDLRRQNVPVVVDLSGHYLNEAVAGGATVIKVSHEELIADGRAGSDDIAELRRALVDLAAAGADLVIVTRAEQPTLALMEGRCVEVRAPVLSRVDHRGAGDALTGGVAAALAQGRDSACALRLGAAAAALNVARHGLATGDGELIERFAARITVEPL